jgi:cation:H+ antiporter
VLFILADHIVVRKQTSSGVFYLRRKNDILLNILLLVIGFVFLVKGADIFVDGSAGLARNFRISPLIIGLTIVAIGTSLPELVTSVTAAKKGKADIAIGNIVGSNMFNIMFVVGTTALITPVPFAANFIIDMIVSIAAELLLWICVFKKHKLNRAGGAIMLAGYAAYFVYLMMLK